MKILDGTNSVLGRIASYASKEAIKGEEIRIINCNKIIITGSKKVSEEKLLERRQRVGSGQTGPKVSRLPHLIVKRAIRGMIGDHRKGRGKEALKRIKCYASVPKELEAGKIITKEKEKKRKFSTIEEIIK